MSASVLREAAASIRERAAAASAQSGPEWTTSARDDGAVWVEPAHLGLHGYRSTAVHIASWHPAVALAVADWLEVAADRMDVFGEDSQPKALATARAYLGRDA
jgi:hypothetical protein